MRRFALNRLLTGTWIAALTVSALSCGSPKAPSSVSRFPGDLADRRLEPSGIYGDGWVAPDASLNLFARTEDRFVVVRGMVPKIGTEDFRTDLTLLVDNKAATTAKLSVGEFALEARLAPGPGQHRIGLALSASQRLPAADGRIVGARLSYLGFAQRSGARAEITANCAGVRVGTGWYPLETFKGETFRWVEDNAELLVTGLRPGGRRLALTLESGPGFGGRPFALKVVDESAHHVATARVTGRKTINMLLPVAKGQERRFFLRVDGGGKAARNGDARILNFRVLCINEY